MTGHQEGQGKEFIYGERRKKEGKTGAAELELAMLHTQVAAPPLVSHIKKKKSLRLSVVRKTKADAAEWGPGASTSSNEGGTWWQNLESSSPTRPKLAHRLQLACTRAICQVWGSLRRSSSRREARGTIVGTPPPVGVVYFDFAFFTWLSMV
jgi:hypothetical protein